MKRAGSVGRRIVQVLLLMLSAVLLLYFGIFSLAHGNVTVSYNASAPDVEITLHPGLPQNWMLNAADARTLDMLPGVGPVLAERIVAVREQDGPFFFPEDLISVKGIGKKTTNGIIDWLNEHPEMFIVPAPADE